MDEQKPNIDSLLNNQSQNPLLNQLKARSERLKQDYIPCFGNMPKRLF